MSCLTQYCISNTSYSTYNDNFSDNGTYDGYQSWSGSSNGYFIYFKTGTTQWCLSNTLGGDCLLSGKSPCSTECPDLFDSYLSSGTCPTPTPTPTNNCSVLDFESYFDCVPVDFVTPTPTPTPTNTLTPTPTPTYVCGILKVEAEITSTTPTPTPTRTVTPTPTREITRDCSFSGDVTFNTVNVNINCPISKQFSDCGDPNIIYTTTDVLTNPGGGDITEYMVFNADVDGYTKCLSYIGVTYDTIGGNSIKLNAGPLGYSNLGGCTFCQPTRTPTPTPTGTPIPTPTPTPTRTQTPTPSVTQTVTPSVTQTLTPSVTPTKTPTPTVTPSSPTIDQCLTDFKIVATYYHEMSNVLTSGRGTCTNPSICAPCGGGHTCCGARFYVRANTITVYDSIDPTKNTVSLNNSGCSGIFPLTDDLNYPTEAPYSPGYVGFSRYDEITISSAQAQTIAAASPDGNISFSLVCADPTFCHSGVTWIRLYRNGVLIYNGCPTDNFVKINPCTGVII